MLKEIKYRLFTIFLTQKKKLVLSTCLVFFGLFIVPQITHAFVLDLANVQLDALDFIESSVLRYLVLIALLAAESIVLLGVSANLLDWSAALPVTLSDNGLVNAGWGFTSGLANLAFILIFIFIALSYILNLETFGMKKALPRLIIIALLVNFSLLFVKMLADVGWIFQNSFVSVFFENGKLGAAAIEPLLRNSAQLMTIVIGIPAAYAPIALIPYGNVAALLTIGLMLLSSGGQAILLGTVSQTIMVIIFNFIVGFVFLVFSALFLIRIAVIWLLAIFAPLAFIAYIMPSTQKYFSQWLKTLAQWIFLGVVVFFLMGLGIKMFGLVDLGSKDILFPAEAKVGNFQFFDAFYKYIFLIIYLVVVLGFCKKFVPAGADMIWGLAAKTLNKGGKWVAGKATARVWTGAMEAQPEWAKKIGEKYATLRTPKPGWGANQGGLGGWFKRRGADIISGAVNVPYGISRSAGRAIGPEITEVRGRAITKAKEEATKISSTGLLLSKLRDQLAPGGSIDKAIGLASGGIEKGSVFKKTLQDSLTPSEKERLGLGANRLKASNIAERFGRSFIDQAPGMGFRLSNEDRQNGYMTITQKLIREATKDELKDFAKNFWLDAQGKIKEPIMTAIIEGKNAWGGPQLGKAADEFGKKFVNDYMSAMKKIPVKNFIKLNPKAALYLSGNAAQDLGFESPGGLSSDDIRKEITGASPKPKRPSPPPGFPSNWIPGPGGTWVPPTK